MANSTIADLVNNSDYASLHQEDELLAVDINNPFASARIFLQGAQLTRFQPRERRDIIWCSPDSHYRSGVTIRGGIPICWPWFGALDKNPPAIRDQLEDQASAAAHGFVRQQEWQLDLVEDFSNHTAVKFSYHHKADRHWPFNCLLSIRFEIGEKLKMRFIISNAGDKKFHFSHALHSYFPCENIDAVSVTGLQACDYIDTLADWSVQQQQGPLHIVGETDRIYTEVPAKITILEALADSAIALESQDHHCAVVWNPWIEKSRRLSGFPDDGYQTMLCVESANVLQHCQSLAPGETRSYALMIGLE